MVEQSGPLGLTEEQLAQVSMRKPSTARNPMCASSRIGSALALHCRSVAGPHGLYPVSLGIDGLTSTPSCSCASDAGILPACDRAWTDLYRGAAKLLRSAHADGAT